MNRKIILKSRPEKEPLKENFQIIEKDLNTLELGPVSYTHLTLPTTP